MSLLTKQKANRKFVLLFSLFLFTLYWIVACSLFTHGSNDPTINIQRPPQKISSNDASIPMIKPVASQNKGRVTALKIQASSPTPVTGYIGIPRVEKTPSGQISAQLKTDSLNNISGYYIFPKKLVIVNPDTTLSNTMIIPSWQIEW